MLSVGAQRQSEKVKRQAVWGSIGGRLVAQLDNDKRAFQRQERPVAGWIQAQARRAFAVRGRSV